MTKYQTLRAICIAIKADGGFVPCSAEMAEQIIGAVRLRPDVHLMHWPQSGGIVVTIVY